MNAPLLVHISSSWVENFLTVTKLGEWIMMRAGRFHFPAGSRLRCELEILCRYEALYRPLNPSLEAEAQSMLAKLPAESGVQVGFLTESGELQPLLGGEPGLPGTAARIDVLKEAAACLALEQFIPDSTRIGLGLAFGITGTTGTAMAAGASGTAFAGTGAGEYAGGCSGSSQELYALPNCVRFACIHNRETAPDDPFRFLDLLLQEPLTTELDTMSAKLAEAARAELFSAEPHTDDAGFADINLDTGYRTTARQLYGLAAYTAEQCPTLLHGVIRRAQTQHVQVHPPAAEASQVTPALQTVPPAQVLVCTHYRSEYEPLLEQVDLLIEEDPGRLSSGALAARRHGIPCVNGIRGLSRLLLEGSEVLVDQRQAIITVPHQ